MIKIPLEVQFPQKVTQVHVILFLCCATILGIIQFCNFCQLSFWMRSILATVTGVVLLLLLYTSLNRFNMSINSGDLAVINPATDPDVHPLVPLIHETVLAFFLLLLLVWFLNREFEVSYRLHYHGNVEADKHRTKIKTMRDQAEWLLGNIIPIHVADQLKVTQSYSKNHDSVGVIFASIVNFSEFYEESYEGGKECYRVLNELIGDFDELLRKPEFKSVEKIKTIGATYMAASGLNVQQMAENEDDSPHTHLVALFNFAIEMIKVLNDFNKNMLGFGFKLRIGYNHGPLTAGVIGTTKLLYDIWGDTVNIASRMDSTGVECRVQVSEESHAVLCSMGLEFDYRGTVNVKGKGQMRTFLYPKSGETLCQHIEGMFMSQEPPCVSNKRPLSPAPLSLAVSPLPHISERPEPLQNKAPELRDEGYRDSSQLLDPSPEIHSLSGLDIEPNAGELPFQQRTHPSATLHKDEEEEEEVNELTKLNEEFYSRL